MMQPGSQFRDIKGPLQGSVRNPQGRLFAPIGEHQGDPWAMAPERWVAGETNRGGDVSAWHSSHDPQLARRDDPTSEARPRQEEETEWGDVEQAEDESGRPLMTYGSGVGMHFGTMRAATERDDDARPFVHPVRLPGSTMQPGRGGRPWSDEEANISLRATTKVEQGGTIPYTNVFEHTGSTSYRALPETARTWSEDVLQSAAATKSRFWGHRGMPDETTVRNRPHPALQHVAKLGYEPVVAAHDIAKSVQHHGVRQLELPGMETPFSMESWKASDRERKRRVQLPELSMMGPHEADKWVDENPRDI